MTRAAVLRLEEVTAGYGAGQVLHGVSLDVREEETVCLLGRNGAGKTTVMRTIMGLVAQRVGTLEVAGAEVIGWPPHRIARAGVGYVPEDRRIFPTLTVQENLDLAARRAPRGRGRSPEEMYALFPVLSGLRSAKGATLSGGEQQMLALARGLMPSPRLLLLDEPTEGLAPVIVEQLRAALGEIASGGVSMLLTEQKVEFALGISSRAYVMDRGEVRFEGSAEQLARSADVLDEYLAVTAGDQRLT